MKGRLFDQFVAACNYPGRLDEVAVNEALHRYCKALKVQRRIVRVGEAFWRHDVSWTLQFLRFYGL
jgi:Flp pilus assembly CpaE family ATPase